MAIDQVVTTATDRWVILLLDGDNQVTAELINGMIALTNKAQLSARFHTRLDLNLFQNFFSLHQVAAVFSIILTNGPMERDLLCASVEELEKGAGPVDLEVISPNI